LRRLRSRSVPAAIELPRRAPLAALATILVLDRVLARLPTRPLAGIVDEAAHLATGTIVLAASGARDEAFAVGLAAGSVLIDVDHVPELWGRAWLRPRGVRPVPHSLATPALVARLGRGRFARGAAVGLAAHLARDLATGTTRVALLWPLTRRGFSIRYGTYFAVLALLAARSSASRGRRRAGEPARPPPVGTGSGSPPAAPAPHPIDPGPGGSPAP
jgi:hypothetical protein